MTNKKLLLLVQSALCVIVAVMLIAGAVGIYRDGAAEKQENPLAWIYTREKVAAALNTVAPVIVLAVATTVGAALLGVRDENQGKPVKDSALSRDLLTDRAAKTPARDPVILRLILLTLAVVFIITGILNGGMSAVVSKAIRICTECVGLG